MEPISAEYQATVDWPGMDFWRELGAAYPEAKVILTVRDPERWYDSAAETILRVNGPEAEGTLASLPPEIIAIRDSIKPLLDAVMFDGTFQGRSADRE